MRLFYIYILYILFRCHHKNRPKTRRSNRMSNIELNPSYRTFPSSFSRSRTLYTVYIHLYIYFSQEADKQELSSSGPFFFLCCWIVSVMVTWDYVAQQQRNATQPSQSVWREVCCAALFLLSFSLLLFGVARTLFFLLRFFFSSSSSFSPSFTTNFISWWKICSSEVLREKRDRAIAAAAATRTPDRSQRDSQEISPVQKKKKKNKRKRSSPQCLPRTTTTCLLLLPALRSDRWCYLLILAPIVCLSCCCQYFSLQIRKASLLLSSSDAPLGKE